MGAKETYGGYRERRQTVEDCFYRVTRDVNVKLHAGRVLSLRNIEEELLNPLVEQGVLEVGTAEDYMQDYTRYYRRIYVGNNRLDELQTVAQFRRAFDERGIPWELHWRRTDFIAEARRYMVSAQNNQYVARLRQRRRADKERRRADENTGRGAGESDGAVRDDQPGRDG